MSKRANQYIDPDQDDDNPTKQAGKSKVNELENMINALPDDEDEEIGEENSSPTEKKVVKYETQSSQVGELQRRQSSDPDFPIVCFKGSSAGEIISNEDKFHAPTLILSIKTMEYELDSVIEPCLKSKGIEEEVIKKLLKKKAVLTNQLNNYQTNVQNGKLNSKTFPGIIKKAIQDNTVLMKIADAAHKKLDVFRLDTRLKILQKELIEWSPGNIGQTIKKMETSMSIRESTVKKPAQGKKKLADSSDLKPSHKPLSDYQYGGMTVSTALGSLDGSKPEELLKLMTLRKAQYYNMATYLKNSYMPFIPKEEQLIVESRLKKEFLPLLQKIKDLTNEIESGRTVNASRFLLKELPEVTPELFHQMSLSERTNSIIHIPFPDFLNWIELNKIIESCQEALNDEESVSSMLQSSLTGSKEHMNTRKKFNEVQKNIDDYNKIISSLEELHNEPWIPLPKYTVSYENRTINVQNSELEPNVLHLKFSQISKCPTKSYYIEYTIENENNQIEVNRTNDCEYSTGIWNYEKNIALVKKGGKLNAEILKRTIKWQLHTSSRSCCWSTTLKGTGEISLENLNHENTIMQRVSAQPGSTYPCDVEYTLKIKEAVQAKRKKICVFKLDKVFPRVDINAKLPESKTETKPGPAQEIKEESKTNSTGKPETNQQQPQQQPAGEIGALVLTKAHEGEIKTIDKAQIPAGVEADDVVTPDKCERNQCYTYLQQLVSQLEKAKETYMSGFGSVSEAKGIRDKWSIAFKSFTVLESSLQNSTIEPDAYLESLSKLVERDTKILEFYKGNNLAKLVNFMSAKLEIFQKEVAEMKEQMSGA